MQISQEFRLLLLILAAFLIGVIVLFLNPEFRIPQNLRSNIKYYPEHVNLQTDPPDANGESGDDTGDHSITSGIEF